MVAVSLMFFLLASPSTHSKPPSSLIPLTASQGATRVRPATNLTYDATLTCPQQIQDVAISARDTVACFDGAPGGGGSSIVLWRAAAPNKQLAVVPISGVNDPGGLANSLNDKLIAFGDSGGNVYVWNVATGKANSVYTDSASFGVDAVSFSPDGNGVAEGDFDGEVYVVNLKAHTPTGPFIDPSDMARIQAVTYDPDGKVLAITDDLGNIYVWNPSTDQTALSFPIQRSLASQTSRIQMGPQ